MNRSSNGSDGKGEAAVAEFTVRPDPERLKALDAARLQIEKQFGKGSLMQLGAAGQRADIGIVPSGSVLLDAAMGVGGYPRGRIIEIFGPESSGKTTLALHAIAEAQKLGGIAAFVDAEHALDPGYAQQLKVDIDELWVSQPDHGEQALEIVESLIRSGAVDIIVVDSVAALTPRAEIEGDMGDSHMGLQARLMSQALRKLTGTIAKSGTCLVFINQTRMKIGVMFGNPETTTGGNALKFYSSIRIEVRKIETITKGPDNPLGNKVRARIVKNKVAPPFQKVEWKSCSARESRAAAVCSTRRWPTASSTRAAPGTPTAMTVSVRGGRTPSAFWRTTRSCAPGSSPGCAPSCSAARRLPPRSAENPGGRAVVDARMTDQGAEPAAPPAEVNGGAAPPAPGGAAPAAPPGARVSFRLDDFEGPLDLLLQLIQRAEVNIYDIPIARHHRPVPALPGSRRGGWRRTGAAPARRADPLSGDGRHPAARQVAYAAAAALRLRGTV